MNKRFMIFIIIVAAIFMVPTVAIQTNPNMPVVNTVNAADDGDTSWGGGSECEGYSGPPCTIPRLPNVAILIPVILIQLALPLEDIVKLIVTKVLLAISVCRCQPPPPQQQVVPQFELNRIVTAY